MQKILFLMCVTLISSMVQSASLEDALALMERLKPGLIKDHSHQTIKNYNITILAQVDQIGFDGITDDDLALLTPLCTLENIHALTFRGTAFTGKGLKYFADRDINCEHITFIDLAGCPLEDENLVALNAFPNLAHLNMHFHGNSLNSKVSGEFFKHLDLKKLKSITASEHNLSDENALIILNWPGFKSFSFEGTPLSEKVLKELRGKKIDKDYREPMSLEVFQHKARFDTTYELEIDDKYLQDLKLALDRRCISQEAFEWGTQNDIGAFWWVRSKLGCPQQYLKCIKPHNSQEL